MHTSTTTTTGQKRFNPLTCPQYKQADHAHRLHILAVDLDGGPIGASLLSTTALLSGTHGQPTYITTPYSSSEAETYDSIYHRVRTGGTVWGAIIANPPHPPTSPPLSPLLKHHHNNNTLRPHLRPQ